MNNILLLADIWCTVSCQNTRTITIFILHKKKLKLRDLKWSTYITRWNHRKWNLYLDTWTPKPLLLYWTSRKFYYKKCDILDHSMERTDGPEVMALCLLKLNEVMIPFAALVFLMLKSMQLWHSALSYWHNEATLYIQLSGNT